jgi:cell division protein FtsN
MKKVILVAVTFLIIGASCKDKPKPVKKVPAKEEVKAPERPDTIAEKLEQPEPTPEPVPRKPDKYFLIVGSFSNQNNAEALKKELSDQGFESQIITRNWGENSNFYKVSYMGFSDKQEAINKMQEERIQPGKEDVWVLVKK